MEENINELLEELNKIKNTKDIENIEEIIKKAHRIKNTNQELKKENEDLNNRFGLFWREIPEKMIKNISNNEIVYGKSLYSFITKIKNGEGKNINANINGHDIELSRQTDSYLFKDSQKNEYLVYSNFLYKFSKETEEEYIPTLKKKGDNFFIGNSENNILIEGDNYYALQMLQYTHKNKVDVIYIDPPYNTGNNDFKYNDKFITQEDSDKHSRWLSFMHKRIDLAKKLLKEDGLLLISINDNEMHRLRAILENSFEENNINEPFIWLSKSPLNQNKKTKISSICHEYIYSVTKKNFESKNYELDLNELNDEEAIKKSKRYPLSINILVDLEKKKTNTTKNGKKYIKFSKNEYSIEKYNENNSFKKHRFQKRTAQKGHGSFKYISSVKDEVDNEELVMLLDINDKQNLGVKFVLGNSYFQSIPQKLSIKTPSFLGQYQGGYKNFSTAKPLDLIKRLINLHKNKNALVLDFFAGSGTTGQAAWELNKEDGGNRKFILCTNNENNICEDVTFERLKRANEKYGYNRSLEYLKLQHASIGQIQNADKNKNFEYLKELINLKYNSFKTIVDDENFYVNENIAVLKEEGKMEEFFENYKGHENFAFLSSYKTGGYERFKKLAKNITGAKEENIILLSDNYIEETKKSFKIDIDNI